MLNFAVSWLQWVSARVRGGVPWGLLGCLLLASQLMLLACAEEFFRDASPVPTSTPIPSAFTSISMGDGFSCVLRDDGVPVCWGRNNYGQSTPPVGETFEAISSGGDHVCGLRSDGSVLCWGWNGYFGVNVPPAGMRFS